MTLSDLHFKRLTSCWWRIDYNRISERAGDQWGGNCGNPDWAGVGRLRLGEELWSEVVRFRIYFESKASIIHWRIICVADSRRSARSLSWKEGTPEGWSGH